MPTYKSFCWSLGTTSFRTTEFNRKIEKQLELLTAFRAINGNADISWNGNSTFQSSYYDYMKAENFVDGNAPNKPKDAREKTSGLVDIGLIDDNRVVTDVGKALLQIAEAQDFSKEGLLQLPKDSTIYFKQLLKSSVNVDGNIVRPFVAAAYLLAKFGELSDDEFTYLVPLAINVEKIRDIEQKIIGIRQGSTTIDATIISCLMAMDNYQEAYQLFVTNAVTGNLIMDIGINRKSRDYDKPYFALYNAIADVRANINDGNNILALLSAIQGLNGKAQVLWKQYFFNTPSNAKIRINPSEALIISPMLTENETIFKENFFKQLHLNKAKATLSDYFDLNRRYLKISDCVIFRDSQVELDILPKAFFTIVNDALLDIAFTDETRLSHNCSLTEILPAFDVSVDTLYNQLETLYGIEVRNAYDVNSFVESQRYGRFNAMLDNKFTDATLIDLLSMFENRQDDSIRAIVTGNADIPTIFEYVVGIIWYKVSNRQGKILDYLNLSLDADLLPKTHAAGGSEDITYYYEATADYPAHCLLIEATLSEKNTQRRMEMEPVSRHLGDYLLKHKDTEAYCMFVSTFLHLNVIADFRSRKSVPYYNTNGSDSINGMKILPCQTSEIKTMIHNHVSYAQLYTIFEQAFQSNVAPNIWYESKIKCNL